MVWQVILLCALVGITGSVAEARRPNLPVRYYDEVNDGPDWDMYERMEYEVGDRNRDYDEDFRYLIEKKVKQESKGMDVKMDQKMTESKKVHIEIDQLTTYAPLYRYQRKFGIFLRDSYYTTDSSIIGACIKGHIGEYFYRSMGIECILLTSFTNETTSSPLFQYWNNHRKDHFYTTDPSEIGTGTVQSGYVNQGVIGYCSKDPQPGTFPLYRYWNSGYADHLYTIDENDPGVARTVANNPPYYQYNLETIACYVYKHTEISSVSIYP